MISTQEMKLAKQAATAYRNSAYSIIPIKLDGSKRPALPSWKDYQQRLCTNDELDMWFSKPSGVAIVNGKISGNLETLDFDTKDERFFQRWFEEVLLVEKNLLGLVNISSTPRGWHVRYRHEGKTEGSKKIANSNQGIEVAIETRGEGSYAIAPGSPSAVHELRQLYEHHAGVKISKLKEISFDLRGLFLRTAQSLCGRLFNQQIPRVRAGDDFNRSDVIWASLLEPHGWKLISGEDSEGKWIRPGKDSGWSATTKKAIAQDGTDLFCCFTSNAQPLEGPNGKAPCTSYSKFTLFAALNHGGDLKAAAKELGRRGFGSSPPPQCQEKPIQQHQQQQSPPPKEDKERTLPDGLDAYYVSSVGDYYTINRDQRWQRFTSEQMRLLLRNRGFRGDKEKYETASEVDRELYRITWEHNVDWAGSLAGYPVGIHTICHRRCLITSARSPIEPKKGSWNVIGDFIFSMFDSSAPRFLAWLAGSLKSLSNGYPWQPGQALGLTGGPDCGKTLAQAIITEVLGGRRADPTNYLMGRTNFNSDLFGAEHLAIGDKEFTSLSNRARRHYAANIKSMLVEQDQYYRGLYSAAMMLTPFTRLSIATNTKPEAVAVFPNPDDDVSDKLLLLWCNTGDLPRRKNPDMTYAQQWTLIKAEMPAFVEYLINAKFEDELRDPANRFFTASWIAPEVLTLLRPLSQEDRLSAVLDLYLTGWDYSGAIEGTAAEFEQRILKNGGEAIWRGMFDHSSQFGNCLASLAKTEPERVQLVGKRGHANFYRVIKCKQGVFTE